MLAALQAFAFGKQFALGFRPLQTVPVRVPLSWDMFAVQIERCAMSWKLPLHVAGRRITSLHQLSAPFEWDVVYNTRAQYRVNARYACVADSARSGEPNAYALICWLGGKSSTREVHDCE